MNIVENDSGDRPSRRHDSRMIVQDDDAAIAVADAYLFAGLKRSAIYNRWNPKSKYYDPSFPQPLPNTGRKTYIRRADLVNYARRGRK